MSLTPKQNEVYQFIKNYFHTNACSPTQREIKEAFHFKSFGSVQRYIKTFVEKDLITCNWNARRGLLLEEQEDIRPSSYESIPLLGSVAAGIPMEKIEHPDATVDVPTSFLRPPHRYFALHVCGESMMGAGICDGDTLVIRHQNDARNGQRVVAIIDGEATVKTFEKKVNQIVLHPENPDFSPITIDRGHPSFSLVGVVVALLRSYDY